MNIARAKAIEQEKLNSNIRCIEMIINAVNPTAIPALNSNIRCIEITVRQNQ